MYILSALDRLQSRTGKQTLFIELNTAVNPVGMVWCLGVWVLVGLDASESDPWCGYLLVSRNSTEPQAGGDEIFRPSLLVLGPTQPPVQWVPSLSRG